MWPVCSKSHYISQVWGTEMGERGKHRSMSIMKRHSLTSIASEATRCHSEVLAVLRLRALSRSVNKQQEVSMLILMAHVTTKGQVDVPVQDCHLGQC